MGKLFICFGIAVIGIIIILIINIYNKLQYNAIKLNKADVNITNALNKKYNILVRYIEFLMENADLDKSNFQNFLSININSINNIDLHKEIDDCYHEIKKHLDNNEKLLKNETVNQIIKEIGEQDIIIDSCKKYYNDNLVKYNKLVKCFPSKMIAQLCKFSEKNFYPEDKKDELKILENDSD